MDKTPLYVDYLLSELRVEGVVLYATDCKALWQMIVILGNRKEIDFTW